MTSTAHGNDKQPRSHWHTGRFHSTRLFPRTLLTRTFLLISALIVVSVATWLTLFSLAEREPRAQQLAQLTVSAVNITNAALLAASPAKRPALLRDLAETEGVQLYPAEPSDFIVPLADTFFFRVLADTTKRQLGPDTRLASAVNGEEGLWVSFSLDGAGDDEYWLMLPGEHTATRFPWHWIGWGSASLAMALLVAWLIVSRVTLPLRRLAAAAKEVGRGKYPAPLQENGVIELQQLTEAFNRMSESLKSIDSERAEVLAGISHDLRTPLARLRLEAELSISDDDARLAVIEDIEQMDEIIAQFLNYARSNSEEASEPTDINALVCHAASGQNRLPTPPNLVLGELPPVLVRPKALGRAIANLTENARKYGGGDITIETRIESGDDGSNIVIDVIDRGPGIPEGEVERLKRPFTRLENARTNATGTGLGLAIVDRIAAQHGGKFQLLARPGGGLIARLRLPAKRN
ncbi:ATP-binding protein [Propionivibrio limicola]|uniref:ATP-binding protein n=1 Tax=Propionivibrio limicola TaxID=167645 RepID=UPI001291F937|nr:ATP-binding protein [Propionivibrio limicola]